MLEVRGYVKSINDFVYNPIVDFKRGKFDTGLRECNGRATGIVCEDIEYLDLCTGLKDKNGNKIYEGDIYHQGDINIKYMVTWHDTGLMGKQLKSKSYAGLSYFANDIQIIGNIHQNKELLEQA